MALSENASRTRLSEYSVRWDYVRRDCVLDVERWALITQLFVADSLTLRPAWTTMAMLFVALARQRREQNNMVPLARCKRIVINFHIVRAAYMYYACQMTMWIIRYGVSSVCTHGKPSLGGLCKVFMKHGISLERFVTQTVIMITTQNRLDWL